MTGLPRTNPTLWLWIAGLLVLCALAVSNSTAQVHTTDGHMTDALGLRKGVQIPATRAVETPTDVVTRDARIAVAMPAPPMSQDGTIPVVQEMSGPAPVETGQEAPARPPAILPKTASPVPLIGLLGLFTVAVALTIRALRTR